MNDKVLIWQERRAIDLATIRTCLELNGIPVILNNEHSAQQMLAGPTELFVFKNDHGPAVKILFENGYINDAEYRSVMGLNRDPKKEKRRMDAKGRAMRIAVIVLILALLIAAVSLLT